MGHYDDPLCSSRTGAYAFSWESIRIANNQKRHAAGEPREAPDQLFKGFSEFIQANEILTFYWNAAVFQWKQNAKIPFIKSKYKKQSFGTL